MYLELKTELADEPETIFATLVALQHDLNLPVATTLNGIFLRAITEIDVRDLRKYYRYQQDILAQQQAAADPDQLLEEIMGEIEFNRTQLFPETWWATWHGEQVGRLRIINEEFRVHYCLLNQGGLPNPIVCTEHVAPAGGILASSWTPIRKALAEAIYNDRVHRVEAEEKRQALTRPLGAISISIDNLQRLLLEVAVEMERVSRIPQPPTAFEVASKFMARFN